MGDAKNDLVTHPDDEGQKRLLARLKQIETQMQLCEAKLDRVDIMRLSQFHDSSLKQKASAWASAFLDINSFDYTADLELASAQNPSLGHVPWASIPGVSAVNVQSTLKKWSEPLDRQSA